MSNKAVCRTAAATPGLLITWLVYKLWRYKVGGCQKAVGFIKGQN